MQFVPLAPFVGVAPRRARENRAVRSTTDANRRDARGARERATDARFDRARRAEKSARMSNFDGAERRRETVGARAGVARGRRRASRRDARKLRRAARARVAARATDGRGVESEQGTFMRGVDVRAALDAGFGSIALLGATAVSLALANSAMSGAYLSLWHARVGPAALALHMSLHHWVNEGLMAIFFFAVGLEIKREFAHGSLRSLRQAALPCIGALGGMLVPMGVYLACNNPGATAAAVTAGWAIPMATDIAFAMGVYNFFKNKMPGGVAAFLLTLATVDDLGAIAVIAVCFAKSLTMSYIAGAAAATAALFVACKKEVTNMAVYAALGVALWYCLLQGGINADVAGVIAAFAVPAHAMAPAGSDATPEHEGGEPTLLDHLVHKFAPLSALVIMPLFALANTGVPLGRKHGEQGVHRTRRSRHHARLALG